MDGTSPYMVFEPECYDKDKNVCTIWRITVRTPKYYTKRSIKVGNTLRELREAYVINSVKWEDGNLIAMAEMSNISFILDTRSEEHTSELQSLMRISYAVFCLKKQKTTTQQAYNNT